MTTVAGCVFISYRRTDNRHVAGRLRDRLAEAFGESNVFFDVDAIEFGQDFRKAIRSRMADADAVVVVIGAAFDPARLAEPNDFVRLELLEAFNQDKVIVPVVIEGASMPGPDQLPAELEDLSYRHAAPLRPDPDFRSDAEHLIDSLRRHIGAPSGGTTAPAGESRPPEHPSPKQTEPLPQARVLKERSNYLRLQLEGMGRPRVVDLSVGSFSDQVILDDSVPQRIKRRASDWLVAEFPLVAGSPVRRTFHVQLAYKRSRRLLRVWVLSVDGKVVRQHGVDGPGRLGTGWAV